MFRNQRKLATVDHEQRAEALELNVDLFTRCLKSGLKKSVISADRKRHAIGACGGPRRSS